MKISSGILLYRKLQGQFEYFLVKPGGPFYKNQNEGVWTFPKGIIEDGENELLAAKREFREETGQEVTGELTLLGEIKLRKSKKLIVFATESNFDEKKLKSTTFKMECPKNSGQYKSFPEIEKGGWFSIDEATKLINPKLIVFLEKVNDIYQ